VPNYSLRAVLFIEAAMPTQRSVATRFWTSPSLRNVSPHTKLLMLYCLTCPRSTFIGFFRFSVDDCIDETGLTKRQIEQSMHEAESLEFLQWDRETHYVWVCKRVYYEFPKGEISARQQEGIRRILDDAPNSSIKFRLCEKYKGYGKPFMDGYGNGTDPASGSLLPLPDPNTPRPSDSWGSPSDLVELYNTMAPDNVAAVRTVKGSRLEKIKRYLRLFPDREWWVATFDQYKHSRFLSGKVAPEPGHRSFQPDLDWLLSKGKDGTDNCVKVHDGRYRDGG